MRAEVKKHHQQKEAKEDNVDPVAFAELTSINGLETIQDD